MSRRKEIIKVKGIDDLKDRLPIEKINKTKHFYY